jgi:DNA-directed RNA polymerase specialized sigma subunit
MAANKPRIYLKNADLLAETKRSKELGRMTDELGRMLMLLVRRYARKASFAGYSYREDMEGHAIVSLCRTWNSFKPEISSNAFAFYTTCIKNSFIQVLNNEKRHRNTRDLLLVEHGMDPSFTFSEEYQMTIPDSMASGDDL